MQILKNFSGSIKTCYIHLSKYRSKQKVSLSTHTVPNEKITNTNQNQETFLSRRAGPSGSTATNAPVLCREINLLGDQHWRFQTRAPNWHHSSREAASGDVRAHFFFFLIYFFAVLCRSPEGRAPPPRVPPPRLCVPGRGGAGRGRPR